MVAQLSSLVCCVSDLLITTLVHACNGYSLYFLFTYLCKQFVTKKKNELKHIGNTKFVNIGHSSNDVILLDHLDASCEIDPSDWLVDKTTKVRHDT